MYAINLVNSNTEREFYSLILDAINDNRLNDTDISDMHNEVFNTDMFIIGYFDCTEWIKDNNLNTFEVIGAIKDYETDNFGKITTDISDSEKVVNMFAYILGEEIINSLDFIDSNGNETFTDELLQELKEELEEMI